MRADNIEVGNYVVVREWEDMAKEYGELDGDIQIPRIFTAGMKRFCGQTLRITDRLTDIKGTYYYLEGSRYMFSPEMFGTVFVTDIEIEGLFDINTLFE